jgi:dTDP-4-amino-4,6-dideoxygalactose transaminase
MQNICRCSLVPLAASLAGLLSFPARNRLGCSTAASDGPSFNGKMSEYHAAVGLAGLDGWDTARANLLRTAATYRNEAEMAGLKHRIITAPEIASYYTLFIAEHEEHADAVCETLDRELIEHRAWYGRGLHQEPAFAVSACDPLPNTVEIASRLIGLPTAPDLRRESVHKIVRAARASGSG